MTGSFRASPSSEGAWCSCSADIKPLAFRRAKTPCNWEECCAGQENRVAAEFSGIHENRTRRIAAAPAGGGIRGRRNAERAIGIPAGRLGGYQQRHESTGDRPLLARSGPWRGYDVSSRFGRIQGPFGKAKKHTAPIASESATGAVYFIGGIPDERRRRDTAPRFE